MRQIHVVKWGHGLGLRIPCGIAEDMRIEAGDVLELTLSQNELVFKKAVPGGKRYALADILDSFTPAGERPEIDFGEPRGEEIC